MRWQGGVDPRAANPPAGRQTGPVSSPTGRFAPSPTGPLHVGNLRTALVSWCAARSAGGRWLVRMEDLDRVTSSPAHEAGQLADLAALGLEPDGLVVRQSERFDRYDAAISDLDRRGLVYRCYCTRREIREAASAPHGELPDGAYPGTCRGLDDELANDHEAAGRRPAWRLRAEGERVEFIDLLAGRCSGVVDDVVLRRNDGVPAYNLAVVVDDAAQGVTDVVRGDDLVSSTPRQLRLAGLLGLPTPRHLHVPLVLGPDGSRLAKRHGAVTLAELTGSGHDPVDVRSWLARSLGLAEPGERPTLDELVERFEPAVTRGRLPRAPWRLTPADVAGRGSIVDRD